MVDVRRCEGDGSEGERKDIEGNSYPFAAANSGHGFVSFFEELFNRPEIQRRIIIKGGPGTGKSGLLRRLANDAERGGRSVRRYRCSSDPDSLDGIVVDGSLAVIDGTAPHAAEPIFPGARDEIVNLGAFWDGARLAERYEEIRSLGEKKQDCYRRATRYLCAAENLRLVNDALLSPYVKHDKLQRAVDRLLAAIPSGKGFAVYPELRFGIGMKGRTKATVEGEFGTYLYSVADYYETGHLLLRLLCEGAKQKRCAIRVFYDPVDPSRPDGVLFLESGIGFLLDVGEAAIPERVIYMRRFVDNALPPERRGGVRMNRRLSEAMLRGAEDALAEAGSYHGALEAIYGSCMDFESLNRMSRELSCRLFG